MRAFLVIVGLGGVVWGLWLPSLLSPALVACGAVCLALPMHLDGPLPVRRRRGAFLRFLDHLWQVERRGLRWVEKFCREMGRSFARILTFGEYPRPAAPPAPQPLGPVCVHKGEPVPVKVRYPELGLAPERTETVAWLCPECREPVPAPFRPPMMARGSLHPGGVTGRTMLLPEGVTYTRLGGQVEPARAVHPRSQPGPTPDDCGYCNGPHHRYDGTHACRCAGCGTRFESHEEWADAVQMAREDLAEVVARVDRLSAQSMSKVDGLPYLSRDAFSVIRRNLAAARELRDTIVRLLAVEPKPDRLAVVDDDPGDACRHCGEAFAYSEARAWSGTPVRRVREPHSCTVPVNDPETGEHLGEVRYTVGDANQGTRPRRLFDLPPTSVIERR